MNEDSNKYLAYFIVITAIFCLSTGIIHKIINNSNKNTKKKNNLEKSIPYSNLLSSSFVSSDQNNSHEQLFDETAKDSNYKSTIDTFKTAFSSRNRINYIHSNGKNHSLKSYEKYENHPLFKEIASKALIYSSFLNWFKYFDELEQILKDEKLSKSLLKILQNKKKKLSKDQVCQRGNNKFYKIIKSLKTTNAKQNHSLNTENSISKQNTFFTIGNKNYFSLKDYQVYEDTPLFKEIASKALIQLDFFYWFTYKKELQIIFNDEKLSNCLLEILQYEDKEFSQHVFYNMVDKINKEQRYFVQKKQKTIVEN